MFLSTHDMRRIFAVQLGGKLLSAITLPVAPMPTLTMGPSAVSVT